MLPLFSDNNYNDGHHHLISKAPQGHNFRGNIVQQSHLTSNRGCH